MRVSSSSSSPPPEPEPTPETPPLVTESTTPPVAPPTKGKVSNLTPSGFLSGFDVLLAAGVVVLGFTIASFAVRNSDFWLHLGTGRLIAKGDYQFGRAPFTFVGEDRAYVNHSWLFDLILYGVWSLGGGTGAGIVGVKAFLVALTALLLLAMSKAGHTLWFSVLAVGLALFAAAPEFIAHPQVVSVLFLTMTIYLVQQITQTERPTRPVIGLVVLFWFWANLDAWFILGPAATGLFVLGESIRRSLRDPADQSQSEPRTNLAPLVKAFGLGIVVCMLNPHHIRVWELPAELTFGKTADLLKDDPELGTMFRSIQDEGALDFSGNRGGNPVNSLALVGLVLLMALGMVANFRHMSWGLSFVGVAMLILAFLRARAIPFFAVAAAPVVALNLAAYAHRMRDRHFSAGSLAILSVGRYLGRTVALIVGIMAFAAGWAGWLQPFEEQRRLAWNVQPDESLKRGAEELQRWRTREQYPLPPEARGLNMQADFAHYCAWFAPTEKSYFDSRVKFHIPEVEVFTGVRKQFKARTIKEMEASGDVLSKLFREHQLVYLVQAAKNRADNTKVLSELWTLSFPVGRGNFIPAWNTWTIQGRCVIVGYARQPILSGEHDDAMKLDMVSRLMQGDSKPIPAPSPTTSMVHARKTLVERFLFPIEREPAEAQEAELFGVWQELDSQRRRDSILPFQNALALAQLTTSIPLVPQYDPLADPTHGAAAVLSLRAARKAIAESPQHPAGYLALGKIYSSPHLRNSKFDDQSFSFELSTLCFERAFLRCSQLDVNQLDPQTYFGLAQIVYGGRARRSQMERGRRTKDDPLIPSDLELEAMKQALVALKNLVPLTSDPTQVQAQIKAMEAEVPKMEEMVKQQTQLYLSRSREASSITQRARMARQGFGLYRKAQEELAKFNLDDPKIHALEKVAWVIDIVDLYLITGQLEEAIQRIDLDDASVISQLTGFRDQAQDPQQYALIQQHLARWYRMKLLAATGFGDYPRLIQIWERDAQNYRDSVRPIPAELVTLPRDSRERTRFQLVNFVRELGSRPGTDLAKAMGGIRLDLPLLEQFWRWQASDVRFQQISEMGSYHLRLGLAYLESGNLSAAREQFEAAQKPFGLDVRYQYRRLADYYARMTK